MNKFDDIRPYYDSEIHDAMTRICSNEAFPALASYVYPDTPIEEARRLLESFTTIYEFQTQTMKAVNERVIANSITRFSGAGAERLDRARSYLYVSNHRDIMLDACLLQYYLVMSGFDTSEITFGANLMVNPFVVDIGKSNKMFKIDRPGHDRRAFYKSSLHTSEYIRHAITEKRQSAWIAQRNGRTKDGNDVTDPGVIKMFRMSRRDDMVASIAELNIVPMAVSYEWESCDELKALEIYNSRRGEYVKKPGEDMHSVLTGILQQKGQVHIELCAPLTTAEIAAIASCPDNDFHKGIARKIDERIISAYRLYPNNYIACDLLYSPARFSGKYDEEQKATFLSHIDTCTRHKGYDAAELRKILLGIYANPVKNKYRL